MPISRLQGADLRDDAVGGLLSKVNEIIGGGAGDAFDVRTYGARGDGTTDDTAAIQSALAACSAAGGGTVYIPNGTYIISATPGGLGVGCLYPGSNTIVQGQSKMGAILKLAAGQPDATRPVILDGVQHVTIRNLTIDGNKANQTVQEHRAGIFVWRSSGARPIPRFIYLADLYIHDNSGDAVDFHQDVQDVVMERCVCTNNDRKAVTVNAGFQYRLTIRDNYFAGNFAGSLFTESNDPLFDLLFEGNYCESNYDDGGIAISYAGPGAGKNNVGAIFRDNVVKGCIQLLRAENVQVVNNRIEPTSELSTPPLMLKFECINVLVQGNDIYLPNNVEGVDAVILVAGAPDSGTNYQSTGVRIIGNRLRTDYDHGHGIDFTNVRDAMAVGNDILCDVDSIVAGITANATIAAIPTLQLLIANNHIRGFKWGVGAGGTSALMAINDLVITGNVLDADGSAFAVNAWSLDQGGFGIVKRCALSGNDVLGYAGFDTYPPCPVLIGGSRGAGGIYLCTGTPEGAISETVGAMAMRRDGGATTTLYVKTSGTGNTGWTAK